VTVVLVQVHFDSGKPQARKNGVMGGYHPDHQFDWADFMTGGICHFCDNEVHYYGETQHFQASQWPES